MIDLKNKKVLVAGLGISGFKAAEFLASKGAFVRVSEGADNDNVRRYLSGLEKYGIEYEAGLHSEKFCKEADMVVVSPGVSIESIPVLTAKRLGIPVIGEMELGFMFSRAPVIAITGTNGKSTTTELIGNIIACSGRPAVVCGNIGNPLCGEINRLTPESIAVVEVSSFQLETIRTFRPYIAVLLNITEDHYDRHGNFENYKLSKFRIFENQAPEDWAVLYEDFMSEPLTEKIKSRKVFYSGKNGYIENRGYGKNLTGGSVMSFISMICGEIPIKGIHNMENISCAVMTGRILGLSDDVIRRGIIGFRPLHHRFEKVREIRGIEFIDDSKATNIDATKRALESAERKVILIAGGRDKGGDYRSILPVFKDKVKSVVLIGEAGPLIKKALGDHVENWEARNMTEAVRKAFSLAQPGEAVLLSPMCSSFDMYASYKHRGSDFQKEVMSLN
ncbi:MAG: UDP-N-acetylmuramoyl-L-alanine--D-glutamate ligase [Candidatus Omnitrophota bacterium]